MTRSNPPAGGSLGARAPGQTLWGRQPAHPLSTLQPTGRRRPGGRRRCVKLDGAHLSAHARNQLSLMHFHQTHREVLGSAHAGSPSNATVRRPLATGGPS